MVRDRVIQIDVLKGIAVLAVVATHSFLANELVRGWAVFHIWQAVPVFVIMLGITSSLSFGRTGTSSLRQLFNVGYLKRRAGRILVPFAVVWVLAAVVGRAHGKLALGPATALLRLPYGGPGNYFVPLVVTLLLLAPLVYVAYRRAPLLTVVAAFVLDAGFEIAAAHTAFFTAEPFAYSIAFPRYLAAFALGFWLSDERVRGRTRVAILAVGALASVVYLVVGNLELVTPPFIPAWRTQNLLAVFYPTALVWMGMRFLPSTADGWLSAGLARIGRASYHVFLVQMLYFTLVGQGKGDLLVVNLVLTTFLGLGFFDSEEWVRERLARRVQPAG